VASRAFKDINLSFKRHPVTNDVLTVSDEDAIKRSVKNIIFTILGEKPFEPEFGSVINDSLFELNTSLNEMKVSDEIKQSLLNFEPRIDNIRITVSIYPDSNELNCTVQYDIVGIPAPTQEVDVLLFPARV
jgi:phage baseplate assembly protein W